MKALQATETRALHCILQIICNLIIELGESASSFQTDTNSEPVVPPTRWTAVGGCSIIASNDKLGEQFPYSDQLTMDV